MSFKAGDRAIVIPQPKPIIKVAIVKAITRRPLDYLCEKCLCNINKGDLYGRAIIKFGDHYTKRVSYCINCCEIPNK